MRFFARILLIALTGLLLFSVEAFGGYSYTINPVSLDHGSFYTWGIDASEFAGETVMGATLKFEGINDTVNPDYYPNYTNYLHVHLLDYANPGLRSYFDYYHNSDAFDIYYPYNDTDLFTTTNIPYGSSNAINIEYDFAEDTVNYGTTNGNGANALASLISYLDFNNFGIGFDPDCHFNISGITLEIKTDNTDTNAPVPEPATLVLLGTGLLGFSGIRKIRKKTM